jgi:hypothetical protein
VEGIIESDVLVFFVAFVSVTCTVMFAMCVAVFQGCLELLVWFIYFLLFTSRMSPDKKMKSIVSVRLSLISFIWAFVRLLDHVWRVMCMQYDIQCVCEGKLNPYFENLFGMKAEWSPTFSHKHSRLHVLLGNIHHDICVAFTPVEEFART